MLAYRVVEPSSHATKTGLHAKRGVNILEGAAAFSFGMSSSGNDRANEHDQWKEADYEGISHEFLGGLYH